MAHSKLSPSSAERWVNCPGSLAAIAAVPQHAVPATSIHAAEGTVAHSLAAELVAGTIDDVSLMMRIGDTVMQDGHEIEITEEMYDGVTQYAQVIRDDLSDISAIPKALPVFLRVEQKVVASSVSPDLWGTADAIIYRKGDTLRVYDFKYGRGHVVEVVDNLQLAIYALAVMDGEAGQAYSQVQVCIVQPRAVHAEGAVRRWTIPKAELDATREKLKAAVAAARAANAPVVAGAWCRWCPAQPTCPAMFTKAQETAMTVFDKVPVHSIDVESLPIEKLAVALEWEDVIRAWFDAVKDRVRLELELGGVVPGWKLVAGRSTRKWGADEGVVAEALRAQGVAEAQMFETKLKSPAQIEKVVGKSGAALLTEKGLIVKTEPPINVAPESDARPAVNASETAASAFEKIWPQ